MAGEGAERPAYKHAEFHIFDLFGPDLIVDLFRLDFRWFPVAAAQQGDGDYDGEDQFDFHVFSIYLLITRIFRN
jgi:hypothetical protein